MKTKLINKEYELFNKLSEEWWDENGKFKILHKIRPIRIKYILDQTSGENIKKMYQIGDSYGSHKISLPEPYILKRIAINVNK